MKKTLSLLLALTLALALTACAPTESALPAADAPAGVTVTTPEPDENAEVTAAPAATQKPKESKKTAESTDKAAFNKTATIEETVLYDADGVTITATALEYDNYDASLKLLIENNSEETLSFMIGYDSNYVNEYMIEDGYIYCDILPGKKVSDSLDFDYDSLMLCGITEIAEIGIQVEIEDEDYDEILADYFEVKTSAAEGYEPQNGFAEGILESGASLGYDVDYSAEEVYTVDDGLEIVSEFILSKQGGDPILVLEAENSSDYPYMLGETQIAVNGIMVCDGPWDRATILAGKRALLYVSLGSVVDDYYVDLFGLTEFGQIDLRVQEYDMEYDETEAYADVSITIPGRETGAAVDGEVVYEGEGIRLYFIDVVEDDDDLHLIFLVENTGDYTRVLTDTYDSTSINGYMVDFLALYSTEVIPGSFAVMDAEIWYQDRDDLGLESPEDITEFELGLKIMTADWDTLDEAIISVVR